MRLIQLFLPLFGSHRHKIPQSDFNRTLLELNSRFGGATAYVHSPATGLWKKGRGRTERDHIILVEVIVRQFQYSWWKTYRQTLERRFDQEELHVRTMTIKII